MEDFEGIPREVLRERLRLLNRKIALAEVVKTKTGAYPHPSFWSEDAHHEEEDSHTKREKEEGLRRWREKLARARKG